MFLISFCSLLALLFFFRLKMSMEAILHVTKITWNSCSSFTQSTLNQVWSYSLLMMDSGKMNLNAEVFLPLLELLISDQQRMLLMDLIY